MKEFDVGSILPTKFSRYQIPKVSYGRQWMELYGTLVASIAFLLCGLVQSYTSPAIYSLESDGETNITLTRNDIMWIGSGPALAAVAGTIISAPLMEYWGRKKSLILCALPSLLGWILIGFATNVAMLHAGRVFTGLSIGISKAAVPVYVSEISRASSRGVLGFLPSMMNALGILLGLWLGCGIHWQKLALLISIFPILLLLGSLWLPESPLWLLLHQKRDAAFKSLERLRGAGRKMQAEEELEEMRGSIEDTKVSLRSLNWRNIILRRENFLGFSLMVFQQFSGVSAVIYFLAMILAETTTSGERIPHSLRPGTAGLTVGIVHFIAFFISLPLIDRVGRRALLKLSGTLMALSHATLAIFLYFHSKSNGASFVHLTASWLPLSALCSYIAAFSIGFGPVPFVFMTEVFSQQFKGYLSSVAILIAQIGSFSVLQLFPVLLKKTSAHLVFFLYALVCFVSVIFVHFLVPETKGKTLSEIEKEFREPPSLLEVKENHHVVLDRVELPVVYAPVSRPITPHPSKRPGPTTICCYSPAVL